MSDLRESWRGRSEPDPGAPGERAASHPARQKLNTTESVIAIWIGITQSNLSKLEQARERRRAVLLQRVLLDEAEWFRTFLPGGLNHTTALVELCRGLGTHLRVEWTRLRPDDTFDGTLSVAPGPLAGEELFEFEIFEENWVKKWQATSLRGVMPPRFGDFLSKVVDSLEQNGKLAEKSSGAGSK